MKQALVIRRAGTADVEKLSAFAARVFSENFAQLYKPEHLAAHLRKTCSAEFFLNAMKDDTVLLAMHGDVIAGYCKFGGVQLPADNPKAGAVELHRFYIDVPYQRQKLGHALMQVAMEQLAQAPEIYLGVWENNIRAQQFYAGYGFEIVGEYLYPVGEHNDRELIMRRG